MNSLRRRIDRFCVLHPNFGIPNLMLYIVIGNIAFYLLSLFSTLAPFTPFSASAGRGSSRGSSGGCCPSAFCR